LLNYF